MVSLAREHFRQWELRRSSTMMYATLVALSSLCLLRAFRARRQRTRTDAASSEEHTDSNTACQSVISRSVLPIHVDPASLQGGWQVVPPQFYPPRLAVVLFLDPAESGNKGVGPSCRSGTLSSAVDGQPTRSDTCDSSGPLHGSAADGPAPRRAPHVFVLCEVPARRTVRDAMNLEEYFTRHMHEHPLLKQLIDDTTRAARLRTHVSAAADEDAGSSRGVKVHAKPILSSFSASSASPVFTHAAMGKENSALLLYGRSASYVYVLVLAGERGWITAGESKDASTVFSAIEKAWQSNLTSPASPNSVIEVHLGNNNNNNNNNENTLTRPMVCERSSARASSDASVANGCAPTEWLWLTVMLMRAIKPVKLTRLKACGSVPYAPGTPRGANQSYYVLTVAPPDGEGRAFFTIPCTLLARAHDGEEIKPVDRHGGTCLASNNSTADNSGRAPQKLSLQENREAIGKSTHTVGADSTLLSTVVFTVESMDYTAVETNLLKITDSVLQAVFDDARKNNDELLTTDENMCKYFAEDEMQLALASQVHVRATRLLTNSSSSSQTSQSQQGGECGGEHASRMVLPRCYTITAVYVQPAMGVSFSVNIHTDTVYDCILSDDLCVMYYPTLIDRRDRVAEWNAPHVTVRYIAELPSSWESVTHESAEYIHNVAYHFTSWQEEQTECTIVAVSSETGVRFFEQRNGNNCLSFVVQRDAGVILIRCEATANEWAAMTPRFDFFMDTLHLSETKKK